MIELKIIRACLRMSQAELGRELRIDRRRVSEIERGDRELHPDERSRVRDLLTREAARMPKGLSFVLGTDAPKRRSSQQ